MNACVDCADCGWDGMGGDNQLCMKVIGDGRWREIIGDGGWMNE